MGEHQKGNARRGIAEYLKNRKGIEEKRYTKNWDSFIDLQKRARLIKWLSKLIPENQYFEATREGF